MKKKEMKSSQLSKENAKNQRSSPADQKGEQRLHIKGSIKERVAWHGKRKTKAK